MTTSLKFYTDATLSTELTIATIQQLADGSSPDTDIEVYLGSTETGKTFQANSSPGVDNIEVSIVDANPGSNIENSDIKIATTSGGLDAAVAGDPISLGTALTSGVANAQAIHIRSLTPALAITNSDISITTNEIIET